MSARVKPQTQPLKPATLAHPQNTAVLALQETVGPVVDTLQRLYARHKRAKDVAEVREKRYKTALEQVLGAVALANLPPDLEVQIEGATQVAKVGKEATETVVIDKPGAFRALEEVKEGLAFELMKFSIEDLKQALNYLQFNAVAESYYTGRRRVSFRSKK